MNTNVSKSLNANISDTDMEFINRIYETVNQKSRSPYISYFDYIEAFKIDKIKLPEIKKVIFNDPATIIYWTDGSKTVVKCQSGDVYNKEVGFITAYMKKICGNGNEFNKIVNRWVWSEK